MVESNECRMKSIEFRLKVDAMRVSNPTCFRHYIPWNSAQSDTQQALQAALNPSQRREHRARQVAANL